MITLIPHIVKWIFVLNLIALVIGLVIGKLGYTKQAKILSYISMGGVALAIVYVIVLFVNFHL